MKKNLSSSGYSSFRSLNHLEINLTQMWLRYNLAVLENSKVVISSKLLQEKCPNTELFLVRIQENTNQK